MICLTHKSGTRAREEAEHLTPEGEMGQKRRWIRGSVVRAICGIARKGQALQVYDHDGNGSSFVKKRVLHGFGMALMLASPLWITFTEPRDYFRFGISLALGILLVVFAQLTPESHTPDR
jgi:hypothetical protein